MAEKKVTGPASHFPSIEKKYGKPIEHWLKELKKVSKLAHMEQVAHLKDNQDLIHKAVGWMLREVGKRDVMLLRRFLSDYSHQMPRTMLRYSIEKLPERERKKWLTESKIGEIKRRVAL